MNQSEVPRTKQRLAFDPASKQVSIDGVPVSLSKTEFRVLQFLANCGGNACTRQQIVAAVQGENYPVTPRSVDVQVAGIRKKLGDAGKLIQTVRGVGFRFQERENC